MLIALKSLVSILLIFTIIGALQFEVAGQSFHGDRRAPGRDWGGGGGWAAGSPGNINRGSGFNGRQEATAPRRGSDSECESIGRQYCPTDPRYQAQLLANPYDCGSFCTCQTGRGRLQACPSGLHFSQALQICTWPWEARCQ